MLVEAFMAVGTMLLMFWVYTHKRLQRSPRGLTTSQSATDPSTPFVFPFRDPDATYAPKVGNLWPMDDTGKQYKHLSEHQGDGTETGFMLQQGVDPLFDEQSILTDDELKSLAMDAVRLDSDCMSRD